jgi:hypothetical protein
MTVMSVWNPGDKPRTSLPKVYAFNNYNKLAMAQKGMKHEAVLLSETGEFIAVHLGRSNEDPTAIVKQMMRHRDTTTTLLSHYPDGYIVMHLPAESREVAGAVVQNQRKFARGATA